MTKWILLEQMQNEKQKQKQSALANRTWIQKKQKQTDCKTIWRISEFTIFLYSK